MTAPAPPAMSEATTDKWSLQNRLRRSVPLPADPLAEKHVVHEAADRIDRLEAEILRLRAAPPGVVVPVPQWRQDKPETAGWYTAYSAERAKVPEEGVEMPSLYLWDGTNWRHYSGWFDHAITHWMDMDLPDPPALNKAPAP